MGHFYDKTTGEPRYEVPNKSTGGMRPATIRDARQNGWVPGATEILKVWGSSSLQNWIVEQNLKAAFHFAGDVYRFDDYKGWANCVKNKADEERKKAADFGVAVHDGVDAVHKGESVAVEVAPWVDQVLAWERENLVQDPQHSKSEFYIKTYGGYGGRVDRRDLDKEDRLTIVDYKTQRARKGKFNFYPSWGAQLSGYMSPTRVELSWTDKPVRLVSFAIDSEDPAIFDSKDWDYDNGLELFNAAFKLYRADKNWA